MEDSVPLVKTIRFFSIGLIRLFIMIFLTLLSFNVMAQPATERVVGGIEILNGEFPFLGFFMEADGQEYYEGIGCSATLIHPQWLLTAKHCVDTDLEYKSVLNISTLKEPWGKEEVIEIDSIIVNPDYVPVFYGSDIALLHLKTPSKITPVTIATLADTDLYTANRTATVLGWGITDTFTWKYVRPEVASKADLILFDSLNCYPTEDRMDRQTEFCAGTLEGEPIGPSVGDSGGPLLTVGDDGQWTQIGITVRGGGGEHAYPGRPGIFTNVAVFSEWIEKTMSGFSDQLSDNTSNNKQFVIKQYAEQITIESHISEPNDFTVSIYNMIGQRLRGTYHSNDVNYLTIEKLDLPEGVFVLVIHGVDFRETYSFFSR